MSFHDPSWLLLLLLLVPWELVRRRLERNSPAFRVADGTRLRSLPATPRQRWALLLPRLRLPLVALAIIALARPQFVERETEVRTQGVDLIVVLDLSTSMLAADLLDAGEVGKNRLAIAQDVLADFIRGRHGDRIGLVAFAARPYPAAPLTLDHEWLLSVISGLNAGVIEDGTAIGDALLSALNRLQGSPAGSRAVILVTDGRSNAGATPPGLAAAAAKTLGIRIHTVGIGSRRQAVIPLQDSLGRTLHRRVEADLDETVLREIAVTSGGSYFRADDREVLSRVFTAIDQLEKRPIETKVYFSARELFPPLLLALIALSIAEFVLRVGSLRRLP